MIKKILIYLVIFITLYSCGKKGDPIYKESKKDTIVNDIKIKILLWSIKTINFFLIITVSVH